MDDYIELECTYYDSDYMKVSCSSEGDLEFICHEQESDNVECSVVLNRKKLLELRNYINKHLGLNKRKLEANRLPK